VFLIPLYFIILSFSVYILLPVGISAVLVVVFVLVQHAVNKILRSLCCHPADVAPPSRGPHPDPALFLVPFADCVVGNFFKIVLVTFKLVSE